MRIILLTVATFLVTTESKVMFKLLDRKNNDRSSFDADPAPHTIYKPMKMNVQRSSEEEESDLVGIHGDASETSTEGAPSITTSALTVPCQDDTGFAGVHLNSLDNVGLYQQYGLDSPTSGQYFNAKFLMSTLEEIKTLPANEVSSAVAIADKLGFFTGHLNQSDTLKSVTLEALRELNGTPLEKLVQFKVAFTLQSNAILYLKTVMALDTIKEQYGEMKPKAFRRSKETREMAQLIRRLENTVGLLRRSLTKPELLSYGDIQDKIDLLKRDNVLAESLAVLEKEEDWVENKISEFLEESGQGEEREKQEN